MLTAWGAATPEEAIAEAEAEANEIKVHCLTALQFCQQSLKVPFSGQARCSAAISHQWNEPRGASRS